MTFFFVVEIDGVNNVFFVVLGTGKIRGGVWEEEEWGRARVGREIYRKSGGAGRARGGREKWRGDKAVGRDQDSGEGNK